MNLYTYLLSELVRLYSNSAEIIRSHVSLLDEPLDLLSELGTAILEQCGDYT